MTAMLEGSGRHPRHPDSGLQQVTPETVLPIRSSIASGNACRHMALMTDSKRLPRPRDPNELAKLITDIATGAKDDRILTDDGRDLAAVLLGRLGGLKGGRARAEKLSPERRSEIAARAAQERWSRKKVPGGDD